MLWSYREANLLLELGVLIQTSCDGVWATLDRHFTVCSKEISMEIYLGQERLVQPIFQYWQNPFLFLAFLGFCLELEFLPNGEKKSLCLRCFKN